MRYLNQRYSAPCREIQAILTDVGTLLPEMCHITEFPEKPLLCGLSVLSFENNEQIKKWEKNSDSDKPFETQISKKTRYINVYATVKISLTEWL